MLFSIELSYLMKSLSQFVKYNHWEKLEENIQAVTESNFITLVSISVIYHSKECFDILIKHTNRINWINKPNSNRKLRKVFENYYNGPNKLNEYYVIKILEIIEYIETFNLKYLMINKNIFHMVFNKLAKTKLSVISIIRKICQSDDVDAFLLVHKFMNENNQIYLFYSNGFIIEHVLYEAVTSGAISIIKQLDAFGYNLSKTKFKGIDVSTLCLTLGITKEPDQIFRYLYNKYPEITQNLLWCNWLENNYSDNYDYYLKLNVDWTPTINFDKLMEDYGLDDNNQNFVELTQDNLVLKIQTIVNELEEEDSYYDIRYYFEIMFNTVDYLIGLAPEYPQLSQYLKTILVIPEVNIMKLVSSVFKSTLTLIKGNNTSTKSRYARSRIKSLRVRRTKRAVETLNSTFNIVRFMKENKLSDYNPIQIEYFSDDINKCKNYAKVIIMHLTKLGFPVSDQFKTEIMEKVFSKTELKTFDNSVKVLKSDNLFGELKGLRKAKKSKKKITKKKAHVPAMDDSDDEEFNELVNGLEPNSDTDNSDNEIEV
jgi:hypothetical protein